MTRLAIPLTAHALFLRKQGDGLPLPLHLCQRRLRLGQPERHLHGTVQLDGGGQLSMGLLLLSRLGVQGAETQVTVGLERAHAEFLRQGKGLAVAGVGLFDFRGITMRGNVAEEAQGIRLMTSFLVGTGILEGTGGERTRLLQAAGAQMRLAQGEELKRLDTHCAARGGLL